MKLTEPVIYPKFVVVLKSNTTHIIKHNIEGWIYMHSLNHIISHYNTIFLIYHLLIHKHILSNKQTVILLLHCITALLYNTLCHSYFIYANYIIVTLITLQQHRGVSMGRRRCSCLPWRWKHHNFFPCPWQCCGHFGGRWHIRCWLHPCSSARFDPPGCFGVCLQISHYQMYHCWIWRITQVHITDHVENYGKRHLCVCRPVKPFALSQKCYAQFFRRYLMKLHFFFLSRKMNLCSSILCLPYDKTKLEIPAYVRNRYFACTTLTFLELHFKYSVIIIETF